MNPVLDTERKQMYFKNLFRLQRTSKRHWKIFIEALLPNDVNELILDLISCIFRIKTKLSHVPVRCTLKQRSYWGKNNNEDIISVLLFHEELTLTYILTLLTRLQSSRSLMLGIKLLFPLRPREGDCSHRYAHDVMSSISENQVHGNPPFYQQQR